MQFGFEDLEADLARAEAKPQVRIRLQGPSCRRPSLPVHLPREDPVARSRAEGLPPCYGGPLRLIGETVSEMLDHVLAPLRVIRIRRPRSAERTCLSRTFNASKYPGFTDYLTAASLKQPR